MRHAVGIVVGGLLGLAMLAGAALATAALASEARTATALNLREGPGTSYARIATMPAGATVEVRGCRQGWCGLVWNGRKGYASRRNLLFAQAEVHAEVVEPETWPIFPPYPYRAGHYPKADSYFDMPPYTAVSPSFYRRRFFMMAQERDRYRYMPHIFRDSGAYGDGGGPIDDVDIQGVSAAVGDVY